MLKQEVDKDHDAGGRKARFMASFFKSTDDKRDDYIQKVASKVQGSIRYQRQYMAGAGPQGYQTLCKVLKERKNKFNSDLKSMESKQRDVMVREINDRLVHKQHCARQQRKMRVKLT